MKSSDDGGDPCRIQFLRNFTIEHIAGPLRDRAAQQGFAVEVEFGAYNAMAQEVLTLARRSPPPALVVCALTIETFAGGLGSIGWTFARARDELLELFGLIEQHSPVLAVVNTFIPPPDAPLYLPRRDTLSGWWDAIHELNREIREAVRKNPRRLALADWERLGLRVGYGAAVDRRFGLMMKAPFRKPFLDLYAEEILRILRAAKGERKKVLVADCDNTLWGGVVGELGPRGVALDPYAYPGIAFFQVQHELRQLREQGVLLALCSKNNEADVWEVFTQHPHALLKRSDFAAWRINWQDKAQNIAELAEELRLGANSFVFLEDNPAECARIRGALPEVSIHQVPERLYEYPGSLLATGLFDSLSLTTEDTARVEFYQVERARVQERQKFKSVEDFLSSLEMVADIHLMRSDEIQRVAQLTQRTNQFNLTTRRYTEAEIEALAASDYRIFTLGAADKFGDMGLVGVLILKVGQKLVEMDSLLLSCRVIGRRLEDLFLAVSLRQLTSPSEDRLFRATYCETAKNSLVATLWKNYGIPMVETADRCAIYEAPLAQIEWPEPDFIQLKPTQL